MLKSTQHTRTHTHSNSNWNFDIHIIKNVSICYSRFRPLIARITYTVGQYYPHFYPSLFWYVGSFSHINIQWVLNYYCFGIDSKSEVRVCERERERGSERKEHVFRHWHTTSNKLAINSTIQYANIYNR